LTKTTYLKSATAKNGFEFLSQLSKRNLRIKYGFAFALRRCQRRGREGGYPPSPRTDPCVRNYRTGLFRNTRFRMVTYSATKCLFPAGRFAQIRQPSMSDLCFLCELRIPVSSFPK
jgi:hypothetical protein